MLLLAEPRLQSVEGIGSGEKPSDFSLPGAGDRVCVFCGRSLAWNFYLSVSIPLSFVFSSPSSTTR